MLKWSCGLLVTFQSKLLFTAWSSPALDGLCPLLHTDCPRSCHHLYGLSPLTQLHPPLPSPLLSWLTCSPCRCLASNVGSSYTSNPMPLGKPMVPPPPPPEKVRGKGGKRKYQERGTFWTSEIVAAKTKEEDHSLSSPQESLLGSWLSDSWPGTYRHRLCHRWSLPHCLESGSLGLHLGDIAFQLWGSKQVSSSIPGNSGTHCRGL